MTDTSDSDLVSGAKIGKDCQKELLAAGSTALLTNSPSEAISKYKSVLDKMSCKSSQKTPITHLVLRYALCIAYLKSNDFTNICEAAETLLDMIDSGYASKLPAIYLAIAKAYFALNRFNSALEFIDRGLKAIHNNSKVKQQSWPGLLKPIDETGKDTLNKELLNLQSKCKNIQAPDAICQYQKCLEYSTHVIPAREIYFSDLDFTPFFSILCNANCTFAYHHLCWEHLKNSDIHLKEPQALLGTACPTVTCTSNANKKSFIVEVHLIGSDGFDKPLESWSGNKHSSWKTRNASPEKTFSPIKQQSTNGSSIQSSEDRTGQDRLAETNSKVRSSSIVVSRPEGIEATSANTKKYTFLHSYHASEGKKTAVVPIQYPPYRPFFLQSVPPVGVPPMQHPACLPAPNLMRHPHHIPPPIPHCTGGQTSPVMIPHSPYMVPVSQQPRIRGQTSPVMIPHSPYMVPVSQQPQVILPLPQNYQFYSNPPAQPSIPVEVNQSFRDKGAIRPCTFQQVSCHSSSQGLPTVRKPEENLKPLREFPTTSVVEDFKKIVKNLADEDEPWKKRSHSSNASLDAKEVAKKQVVHDFQRMVHDLAGNGSLIKDSTQITLCEDSAPALKTANDECEPTDINSNLCLSSNSTPAALASHFKELVSQLAQDGNHQDSITLTNSTDMQHAPSTAPNETSSTDFNSLLSSNSAPLVQALSPHSWHTLTPSITAADHLNTQQSTLQAKSKSSSVKEEEGSSDRSVSSSIPKSLCSSDDDIRSEASDSSKFSSLIEALNKCRAMKFGYSEENFRSPQFPCFDHPFEEFSAYLEPGEIDVADKDTAEFVFSLYQSMFDKNGHYKIEDLQDTWKPTVSDLGIPETFTDKYTSVSEFLLKSERFAAIDDVIGTADLLPAMFLKAEVEITESVSYLLFSQVSNPRNTENDVWKTKANINNCDTITCVNTLRSINDQSRSTSKERSSKVAATIPAQPVCKDKNDNPISSVSLFTNSDNKQCKESTAVNGGAKPAPTLFNPKDSTVISSQEGEVYLSEEDDEEEKQSSLMMEDDDEALLPHPCALNQNIRGGICKPDITHQHSQTDVIDDVEKENLHVQKDSLLQQISGLEYEKAELLQRIETLQLELENTRVDLGSKLASSTKQLQDFQENLEKKAEECTETQEKNISLEHQLNKLQELTKEKDVHVSELETTLDKLRRSHAKEINNFGQRLREERKLKEEEFQDQLKLKDQKYIQLWKEYCEYKIKKFNHLCNDRINVLFQLKDMMSDSIRPTKSDIKSLIETYEEEMISVSQKNNKVNDECNRELEMLCKDISYRPSVVDVPDLSVYPPEGAFEYLHNILKSKQDDFTSSRNHFSPAVSRFPRAGVSNGLQSSAQTREPEPFSSMTNTSLFGQGLNETSHLWNNSFSSPTAHSASLSFDVGNSNGPHLPLHQSFGTANSIMSQQPAVNLMAPLMAPLPFPPSSSQATSVQAMMGSARSTPSPLLSFPNVNSMAFNPNAAAGSSIGPLAANLKSVVNTTAPPNPVPKAIIPAVSTPAASVVAPQSVSPQGAVSKPRVQTATAAMTPIVPSKPTVRPVVKGPKTNESNYEKLMRNLQKMFPTRTDTDLTQALKMARQRNGGTLSSLTHSEIVLKVDEILSRQSKQTTMGWEKFGQAAWGTAAKTSVVEWEGTKDDQDECCICMTALNSQEVYTLECKHAFHKECIRKWLLQDGVCPMCRVHSTMHDEFPPLG